MHKGLRLAAAFAIGLAACNEEDQANVASLTGTEWIAQTINGKAVIEPGGVTLTVSQDRVSGRSGCNRYFGVAQHTNGKLKVGSLGSTKMACMREGVMQQESEYLATLQASESFAFEGNGRLVLSAPGGGSLLFEAGPRQQN